MLQTGDTLLVEVRGGPAHLHVEGPSVRVVLVAGVVGCAPPGRVGGPADPVGDREEEHQQGQRDEDFQQRLLHHLVGLTGVRIEGGA